MSPRPAHLASLVMLLTLLTLLALAAPLPILAGVSDGPDQRAVDARDRLADSVDSVALQQAQRIIVDSENDRPDADPGDGVCEALDGSCTLRAAVMEANAIAGDAIIEVLTGTFAVTIPESATDVDAAGDLDITDAVRVVGVGRDDVIVRGPGVTATHGVFDVHDGVTVTLSGLTIREGNGAFGGVRSTGALTLTDCAIRDNAGAMQGGGLENRGTAHIARCRIEDNSSTIGGGVFSDRALEVVDSVIARNRGSAGGGIHSIGALAIRDTKIVSNAGGVGGGVHLERYAPWHPPTRASFDRCEVAGNTGGGIFDATTEDADGTEIEIRDCIIADNGTHGLGSDAGGSLVVTGSTIRGHEWGIESDQGGTVIVRASSIVSNSAGAARVSAGTFTAEDTEVLANGEGLSSTGATLRVLDSHLEGQGASAIVDRNKGTVYISGTTVLSNTSELGGGIAMSNQGALTVLASTIAGNQASQQGGGVYIGNGGTHRIVNSTIAGNGASTGDNIRNGGDLTLVHTTVFNGAASSGRGEGVNNVQTMTLASSILAAETPALACSRFPRGTIVSLGTNVDSDDTCQLDEDLGDIRGVDPSLGPLQDNGGRTYTMALAPNSAAVDHAEQASCPDTDQRGAPRPYSRRCDAGAYEYGAEAPAPPGPRDPWIIGLAVTGTVVSDISGGVVPVEGASVSVLPRPGACHSTATTDENGAFAITCDRAHELGTLSVSVERDGYEPWTHDVLLGPFGQGRGPATVQVELVWAGGPTPTPPAPTPTTAPPGGTLLVPAAFNGQ